MPSSINSTTTSPGGLISTGDNSNTLLIQTGDTTAITINSSQQVALTNPLGAASGGTGLSSPGTNGNVLTSNGTSWVSSALPATGFTGGTTVTSSSNVTLTASSVQVQRINMTAANRNVILPDATTETRGGIVFNIINVGVYPFNVVDPTGYSYGTVTPLNAVAYFLGDNSTSTGKWSTTTLESPFTFATDTSAAATIRNIVALTDTSGVYVSSNAGVITARAYTLSGLTFTWGSPTTIYTNPSSGQFADIQSIIKLADNSVLVNIYRSYPTNRVDNVAVACTISGTTVSAGTPVTIRSSGGSNIYAEPFGMLRLSSSAAVFFTQDYNLSTTSVIYYYNTVTVSGNTISTASSGTWINLGTSGNTRSVQFAQTADNGATVVVGAYNGNNLTSYVFVLTLSGATVTGAAETTSGTAFNNSGSMYAYSPSANTVFAVPTNGASTSVRVVTSGTSATITTASVGSSGSVVMGYENRCLSQQYFVYTIADFNIMNLRQLSYSPNISTANSNYGWAASCNNIPTSSGVLAAVGSGATGQIILVKGWL